MGGEWVEIVDFQNTRFGISVITENIKTKERSKTTERNLIDNSDNFKNVSWLK